MTAAAVVAAAAAAARTTEGRGPAARLAAPIIALATLAATVLSISARPVRLGCDPFTEEER
jgi:hypothetical protein